MNVPETITVRMVNASALEDYEMWVFIASLLSNAVVGFLIAYFQAIDANSPARAYVGWTTILFGILFVLAIMVAFRKRLSLREKGRDIELRTVSAQVRSS